ncbi:MULTISPECIES: glycoside hydrolase family 32 protein [unclassified Actinomyces]|uniref:glycoside hydrolase family 32 protein n=1 Tax=unclassified Actinomyces TaxID=2609248 RepID=UPI000D5930DE|nr:MULTISPECIES: glycoside hydrolase family 32 protein [unclassified Actinomyces]RAX23003.1 glycoside hydrolase family 32 protein [Actinomyces sp. Z5]RAX23041.1 glycoside hydrolase family 32 protein [Actinomyces sp. Z3]
MTEDLRAAALEAVARSHAAADPDYPVVHLAPPVGRLNDPNGLLVDSGTYHAFYQFSPFHPHHKLVYWGHASSRDLLHWTHHDPAIIPDSFYDRSGAYSGGALVLEPEEIAAAPAGAPYQFFYTGNLKDPVTDERTASQCLVTSPDLAGFTKWPDNPLLPDHPAGYTAHYRDPQVWRDPDEPGSFRMLLGVQREDLTGTALLYRSTDLREWELEGELTFPDAGGAFDHFGYMWECPGLVRLTDELTGQVRDVLIWCPQGVAPDTEGYENIFPCVYTVGRLVGTELRECDGTFAELDRGFEFYAPQAFARRPSEPGPVLLTAWAGNASEDDQPSIDTGGWVHALTVPRVLTLRGGRLLQRPVTTPSDATPGLTLVGEGRQAAAPIRELEGHRSWQLRLQAAPDADRWGVRIGTADSCVTIELARATDGATQLIVDRSRSRYTQHGATRIVTLPAGTAPRLEVLHDRSITEVFVGDGEIAFTLRSFVAPHATGAGLLADDGAQLTAGVVVYD